MKTLCLEYCFAIPYWGIVGVPHQLKIFSLQRKYPQQTPPPNFHPHPPLKIHHPPLNKNFHLITLQKLPLQLQSLFRYNLFNFMLCLCTCYTNFDFNQCSIFKECLFSIKISSNGGSHSSPDFLHPITFQPMQMDNFPYLLLLFGKP